jgi:hypothetical protein
VKASPGGRDAVLEPHELLVVGGGAGGRRSVRWGWDLCAKPGSLDPFLPST